MLLLNLNCEVIKKLGLTLSFDDGTVKNRDISVDDYVLITYNKDGVRKESEGTISKIITYDNTSTSEWFIILEGTDYLGAKIYVSKILDIEILRRADLSTVIRSPKGINTITDFRTNAGKVEYSTDNGDTWIPVIPV